MAFFKTRLPKPDASKTILKWAAVGIVVSGLFPPWVYVFDKLSTSEDAGGHWEQSAGYGFLFDPPVFNLNNVVGQKPLEDYWLTYHARAGIKLDVARLAIEWVCIGAVGVAAWSAGSENRNQALKVSELQKASGE